MNNQYNLNAATSYEALEKSARQCCKGLLWKPSVQTFYMDLNHNVYVLYKQVKEGNFKSCICTRFTLHTRGKERYIETVSVRERTVQKAICNYALKPLLIPTLIRDNYATVKGRGIDDALDRMKVFLHKHYKEHGLKGGVLTIDLHSYFDSINHQMLINMLYDKLQDKELVDFIVQFVTMFERDNGISVGNESSQLFAVFFLNELDHYIKEELGIKFYGRYMDDIYLIHEDVEYLHECLKVITEKLNALGITVNPKHTQIHPFNKGQDFHFLKKRVRLQADGKIIVRLEPKAIQKRRRNMKWQRRMLDGDNPKYTFTSCLQSFMSFNGYCKKFDCHKTLLSLNNEFYNLFHDEIETFFNIASL